MSEDFMDIKPVTRSFNDIMAKNPFDEVVFGVDMKYFAVDLSYNKKTGSKLVARLDLTSIFEDKHAREMKAMDIELEKTKLKREWLQAQQNQGIRKDIE